MHMLVSIGICRTKIWIWLDIQEVEATNQAPDDHDQLPRRVLYQPYRLVQE